MKRFIQFNEDFDTLSVRLASHGYRDHVQGTGGHVTFTRDGRPEDQMLIDVPGKEWHHMVSGVVNKIGSTHDLSLEQYLKSH
jgi:hypothetical protein